MTQTVSNDDCRVKGQAVCRSACRCYRQGAALIVARVRTHGSGQPGEALQRAAGLR